VNIRQKNYPGCAQLLHRPRRSAAALCAMLGLLVLAAPAHALKLCTFEADNGQGVERRIGVVTPGGRILDMNRAYALVLAERDRNRTAPDVANDVVPPDMIAWLERGDPARKAIDEALAYLGKRAEDQGLRNARGQRLVYAREEIRLLAPIPQPVSFRDAGGFLGHVRKVTAKSDDPRAKLTLDMLEVSPLFITYAPTSFRGTDVDVLWPNYSDVLDYEIEIAAVIGRKGINIPESEAKAYIAGYTVYNDVSARDFQIVEMTAPFGAGKGKNWDGGNLIGPYLVTADEFEPEQSHAMIVRINGAEISRASTTEMTNKFPKIVSFLSQEQTLYPGEMVGSATPEGGSGMEQARLLDQGDVLELEIEGIGVLRNRFMKSPTAVPKPFPSALATLLPGQLNTLPPRPMKVVEVAPRVYAGIQVAPGTVAFSNMFYVASGPGLVGDTLLDVRRTQQMVDLFRARGGPWPPKYLVNTHGDSDHIWGNQLFKGSEIIAHKSVAASMKPSDPKQFILAVVDQSPPKVVRDFIGTAKEFDLRDVVVTPPTRLLGDGESLDLDLGGVPAHLEHVGPTHKEGDVFIFLPQEKVLFAGDLVFNGLTPHITGSYAKALATYHKLEALAPRVVVPGHGDVTTGEQLVKTRKYFEMVYAIAKRSHERGLSALEAAKQADIGEYANWAMPGQIMLTLDVLYREFEPNKAAPEGDAFIKSIAQAEEVEQYWKSRGVNQPTPPHGK